MTQHGLLDFDDEQVCGGVLKPGNACRRKGLAEQMLVEYCRNFTYAPPVMAGVVYLVQY